MVRVGVDFFTQIASGERAISDLGGDNGFALLTDLFAVRTRFFDDFLTDAGRAGIRQAVILASGLDARPYRLWWPAGACVYEIDQPQVIEFKAQTLRGMAASPTADRRAVGIDLRSDWPNALRRLGFDDTKPTARIAEGLFIGFLAPGTQDRLLDNVTALSAAGSSMAADYMSTHDLAHGGVIGVEAGSGVIWPRPVVSGGAVGGRGGESPNSSQAEWSHVG